MSTETRLFDKFRVDLIIKQTNQQTDRQDAMQTHELKSCMNWKTGFLIRKYPSDNQLKKELNHEMLSTVLYSSYANKIHSGLMKNTAEH